jgi:predicted DNA-binding mobile mystery protein A
VVLWGGFNLQHTNGTGLVDTENKFMRAAATAAANAHRKKRIDAAIPYAGSFEVPDVGWIKSVRLSLGMPSSHLAAINNVSSAAISKTEKAELRGGVTINQMEKLAQSMGCHFVYGIVPYGSIDEIRENQARAKAISILKQEAASETIGETTITETHQVLLDDLIKELLKSTNGDLWGK